MSPVYAAPCSASWLSGEEVRQNAIKVTNFTRSDPLTRCRTRTVAASHRIPKLSSYMASGSRKGPSKDKWFELPAAVFPIAVVDDDVNVRLLVQDILDQTPQFCCVGSYSSGEDALSAIPGSSAKLVLMDIRLPGMSGIECTRRLKQLRPGIVIVAVTGLSDEQSIDLALDAGVDDYLVKPFSVGQVLARLKVWRHDRKPKLLSGKDRSLQSFETPSDLNLLTPEESQLLELLAHGHLYKEIAIRMRLTESVVRNRAHLLYAKIRVTNRTEAAIWFWNRRGPDQGDRRTLGLS